MLQWANNNNNYNISAHTEQHLAKEQMKMGLHTVCVCVSVFEKSREKANKAITSKSMQ